MSLGFSPEAEQKSRLTPNDAYQLVKAVLAEVIPDSREIELPEPTLESIRLIAETIYAQTKDLSDNILAPQIVLKILRESFAPILSQHGFTSVVMRNGYQSREHLLKGTRVWAVGDTSNGHGYSFWFESNNQQIVIAVEKYSVGIRLAGTPE